ncbi:MAG: response regulator [Verrucomicrobiota bacterium]
MKKPSFSLNMSIGYPAQEPEKDSPPSVSEIGILIVDEDPAFQLGLKTFLREYVGFEKVFTACNGREAIDLIKAEEAIELITLDYQMPGMNGIEVMEGLKEEAPRALAVIMITGYPSEELEEEFKSFDSPSLVTSRFLSKPVAFEMLEPLMMGAYEELKSVQQSNNTASPEDPLFLDSVPEDGTEERINNIEQTASKQSDKIKHLEQEIAETRKSGLKRFWFVVVSLGVLWMASEFGLLSGVGKKWEGLKSEIKADVQALISSGSAPPEISPDTAEDAPEPPAADGSPEAPTTDEMSASENLPESSEEVLTPDYKPSEAL